MSLVRRRKDGSLERVTLAHGRDAWNFKKGMTLNVDDECMRIKRADRESGYLVVHRPWWWRLLRWFRGLGGKW